MVTFRIPFRFYQFAVAAMLLTSCRQKTYFPKTIVFDEGLSVEEKIYLAAHVVPTQPQLDWQKLEMTAFLHFGINTFTGREWGDGTESPALFNPENLDAMQWVSVLKEGGMKMVILTAKHHDGFCLWPTETTVHSVKYSPWKNGKGDVVSELKRACDSLEMKFGFYLSPWDRNAESYGDSPRYNEFFSRQLTELLTNYGKVDEVWFDGACGEGPNGKKQVYDWESWYKLIERLQPEAVVAIQGEDVRWVGTETGYGRPTEWSVTAMAPGGRPEMEAINESLGLQATASDLGSRGLIEKAGRLFWYPAEVDVSIRPGWFFHEEENSKIKSLEQLVDIYFNSVGMNAVLLLNIPPDKKGLIHEEDATRLKEFKTWIDETFSQNLLADARTKNRNISIVDDNPETFSTYKKFPANIEFRFTEAQLFDILEISEFIEKGQRVEEFRVEIMKNEQWTELAAATTIGYKRMLRFNPVQTDRIRITILKARHHALISEIGLYKSADLKKSTP